MKAGPIPYDEAHLHKSAGEKVFARGRRYADERQIVLLSVSAAGVLAAAYGTSDYTVWLKRPGPHVAGHCTCPAFEDSGLCKHMVATALLANEAAALDESPADHVSDVEAHLAPLDRSQLQRLLMDLAINDWRVLRAMHFALDLDWEGDLD